MSTPFTREFTIPQFPYEVNKDWERYNQQEQLQCWQQWLDEMNQLRETLAFEYQRNCSDLHLHYAIGRETHNDLKNKTVHNANSIQHPTQRRVAMPGYCDKHKQLGCQAEECVKQ